MTPQEKQSLKLIAIFGGALILIIATILIVKKIKEAKAERDELQQAEEPSAPAIPYSGAGTSSANTLEGRTFTKSEVMKMQSFLFNWGVRTNNDFMVKRIRDTGGIDGNIGQGFKDALAEAIRIGIIDSLDQLYREALEY